VPERAGGRSVGPGWRKKPGDWLTSGFERRRVIDSGWVGTAVEGLGAWVAGPSGPGRTIRPRPDPSFFYTSPKSLRNRKLWQEKRGNTGVFPVLQEQLGCVIHMPAGPEVRKARKNPTLSVLHSIISLISGKVSHWDRGSQTQLRKRLATCVVQQGRCPGLSRPALSGRKGPVSLQQSQKSCLLICFGVCDNLPPDDRNSPICPPRSKSFPR
jgi:hypothetical protein